MNAANRNVVAGVICGFFAGAFVAGVVSWSRLPKAALAGFVAATVFAAVSVFLRGKRTPLPRT
jgi:hypothetical protein